MPDFHIFFFELFDFLEFFELFEFLELFSPFFFSNCSTMSELLCDARFSEMGNNPGFTLSSVIIAKGPPCPRRSLILADEQNEEILSRRAKMVEYRSGLRRSSQSASHNVFLCKGFLQRMTL